MANPMAKFWRLLATVLVTGSMLSPALAAPQKYTLDKDHLSLGFLVHHISYADVLGMFLDGHGEFQFDEQTTELTNLEITVATDSVFTNHKKRDDHLRSPDFLNSKEFPEMIFRAASAEKTGDRSFRVNGELELLGVTRPLTLDITWNRSGEYPFGDKHYAMGASARGTIRRSEFGMNYAVENGWVGDEIKLIIEFEARRQ